ncbi:MAG: autotransporter outer membrane beta-barrel domain-containing protein, partial [Pyramidobacter sp.]|nr:autotransporter outer membrane beta-barrel domain-containing protein [Pyramidobacter sp.]
TAYAKHTNADGGAVYVGQASVNISAESVDFAENAASVGADGFSAHGGAMYLRMGELSVDAGALVLEKNTAYAEHTYAGGGALYNGDGHIVFKAGTLNMKGNSVSAGAEANGGAIAAASGDLNVTVGEAFVANNTAEAASGAARGGAAYIGGGSAVWNTNGSTKFSGNKAMGAEEAAGSAIYVDGGNLTFSDGLVIFAENESSASAGDAYGALTVHGGHLTIASTGTGGETQFDLNTASGVNAYGGAVALTGGNVSVESRVLGFAGNRAEASSGSALGGAIYSAGDVSFIADEGLIMKDNKAAAADGDAFGGAVYAQKDIVISVGRAQDAARAENDGGEIIGDAVFEGNEADLGGALYSEGGDITLTRQKDAGGIFDFVTDTDDVFARIGRISVTGTLIARPGVSFTGGGQFRLGDGSSLVLQGRPHGDDAKPSHFAIFGGDFEKDPAMAVNFNKARLSLTNYDELRAQAGTENRYMADIAAVMYRNDPGLIGANDVSADITGADYALDTSDYRNGRLYLHRTIAQKDAQTDRVKSELYGEDAPIYKLVLAYDRHTLIWRGLDEYEGSDPKWNEGMARNFVWVSAGDQEDSYFTPKKSDDGTKYVQDSFYRGDIVVFDGKKYDSLDYGSAEPMPGRKWTVPLTSASDDGTGASISAARVYVIGGNYEFTNALGKDGYLEAPRLFVLSNDTVADFKLPVHAFEEVSIDVGATASFEDVVALVKTPVEIAGTMNVKRPAEGSYTVYGGGTLTLHDGSGLMNSLTLEDRSTLNINALESYRVSDHFTARTGSRTIITPGGDWAANNGANAPAALIGEGTASASIESGAKLTINGIRPNSTGKWTLLKSFEKKVDGKGWGDIGSGTLIITGSANWNGNLVKNNPADGDYLYEVKTDDEDRDYVLVITKYKKPEEKQEEKEKVPPTPPNPPAPPTPPNPPAPPEPEPEPEPTPGHTDTFHIAGSVQRALSRAAIEPRPKEHLWAHFWRDTGRVYDTRDDLALKTRAYGVILGRDLNKNHKKTWGLAAHIGKGDTSGKGYWDGATSDTNFWGVMLYGRRDEKKWFFSGDASFNWFKTDYTEANGSSADNARSTMFSIGGRAYYKWIDNPQPGQMSVHPFIGARWNYYRQSGYSYNNGDVSRAWKSGQLHVPMGIKIQWGEMESKDGWHVTPTLEASYIRTIGQRSAVTGIHAPGQAGSGVRMPLSARDTVAAEFRYVTRNEKKGFHWELNAGIRRSTSEKDLHVGTTFTWEL